MLSNKNYLDCINSDYFKNVDIVFIVLHGKWGEDGTVQGLLDLKGIKYTGSDLLSSAISIDKAKTKIILRHSGVNTPDWLLVNKNKMNMQLIQVEIFDKIGFPVIVKPNDQGSTIGFSLCNKFEELEGALNLAFQYSDFALIEKYIKGREMTCTILGDTALPIVEIIPKHKLYDYECKYTHGMSEYICPAQITNEAARSIMTQSLKAFSSCGCSVYGRIDFILDENNIAHCLEINTNPGMTNLSLVPMSAKAMGMNFNKLCEKIIELSLNDK